MRLFLVVLFLYLIPITALFLNHKNFKRTCVYGSIYTVLITSIAITNVYISGLNQIKKAIIHKNSILNTLEEKCEVSEAIDLNYEDENVSEQVKFNEEKEIEVNVISSNEESSQLFKEKDIETIKEFKKQIYKTELIALTPMRECIPYTKDVMKSLKEIPKIKQSVEYSIQKCDEVILIYKNMEIPYLLDNSVMEELADAKNEVICCYEFRKEAMQNALNLINTKNPKYINNITEYLKLSDKHILAYKEKIDMIIKNIEQR